MRLAGPVAGLLIGAELNKLYTTFNRLSCITRNSLQPLKASNLVILCGSGAGGWGFSSSASSCSYQALLSMHWPGGWQEERRKMPAKCNHWKTVSKSAKQLQYSASSDASKKKKTSLVLVDSHIEKDAEGNVVIPKSAKHKAYGILKIPETFEDFLKAMRQLAKSPVYVGSVLGRVMDIVAIKGFGIFLAKYLQIQFGVPQHTIQNFMGEFHRSQKLFFFSIASICHGENVKKKISAASTVIGFTLGVLSGSFALRRFKLQVSSVVFKATLMFWKWVVTKGFSPTTVRRRKIEG